MSEASGRSPDEVPDPVSDTTPDAVSGRTAREDGGARDERDALDERNDVSGQRMVNIEPGPGEGDGDDELALRRLFQGAVAGLEPSAGSLDHLRRAVPARRARKRQALVGACAAVVLIGTAVPAFVHVASSGGLSASDAVNAGHGEDAQGGTGAETGVEGGQGTHGPANGGQPSQGADQGAGDGQSPGAAGGPQQSQGAGNGSASRCAPDQLGVSSEGAHGPDDQGRFYGNFRIANVSGQDCVVDGSGVVGFEARGAADPGRIAVVRHTSGDNGSGLPDPSQESSSLVLKPNGSYEVKFVWVPSETCPTTGTTPTPPPPTPTEQPTTQPPTVAPTTTADPGPSTGTGGTGTAGSGAEAGAGSDAGTGTTPQLLHEDGAPADGSVVVSHTAEPGGPTASAIVTNACAGVIYRTGILNAS
ncbi:hypothetical protein [Streptomyces sp. NPDC093089]|uniref:hypothetical protein n=1 Tax=Streptomyces sp. NPDC093089 TaxID=3366024 RepID=UPI00380EDB23